MSSTIDLENKRAVGSLNTLAVLDSPEHIKLQLHSIRRTILTLEEKERFLNELLTEAKIHQRDSS